MHYRVINNLTALQEFVDWLPELEDSQTYFFTLFGRKKYCSNKKIQSGCQTLSRFVCRKEHIIDRIRQLEVPLGAYKNREIELPQECLGLYICVNPRCHEKAAKQLLIKLANKITQPYEFYNVKTLAMTELHKACGNREFVDFDFDDVTFSSLRQEIEEVVNIDACSVVTTRSGFHLLVKPKKVFDTHQKTWYNGVMALGADVCGDKNMLVPVPGTVISTKVPRLILKDGI